MTSFFKKEYYSIILFCHSLFFKIDPIYQSLCVEYKEKIDLKKELDNMLNDLADIPVPSKQRKEIHSMINKFINIIAEIEQKIIRRRTFLIVLGFFCSISAIILIVRIIIRLIS